MKTEMLTKPLQIKKLHLRNRMVMPPMNTNFSDINGAVTPQMSEYYVRRARGGTGLIVVEAASVVPDVKNHGVQPMLYDKKFVPGWHNMVERIHRFGAKASVEIVHYGSEGAIGPKVSSSNICSDSKADVTPLSVRDIRGIQNCFIQTASNAKAAEFDAVTLHAAHGYLIAQFLSPLYNKRSDEYGGSLENRCRFLLQIVEGYKDALGPDYPIMVRISGDEYVGGGLTVKDTKQIAIWLQQAGISAIDVSGGIPLTYLFSIAPYNFPGLHGFMVKSAREIKSVVSIPVIVAGGIRDAELAEKILQEGSADLVALGRAQIADPDFCNKVVRGQYGDIRMCLSCQECLNSLDSGRSLRCAVNPEAGREWESKSIARAEKPKKVVIVGAGPAGMEAARVAALRGHSVVLMDKASQVGGTLNAGCLPPCKDKLRNLVNWFNKQLGDLKVEVRTDSTWSNDIAEEIRPDVLILATGSEYSRAIPGSERSITASEALLHPERIGEDVIILGGGATGCETAEFIAGKRVELCLRGIKNLSGEIVFEQKLIVPANGKRITIVEMLNEICSDMYAQSAALMRLKLRCNGVKVLPSTKVLFIGDGFIQIEETATKKRSEVPFDTVILAYGLLPNKIVASVPAGCDVYSIGDCVLPGKIIAAIYGGYCVSMEI